MVGSNNVAEAFNHMSMKIPQIRDCMMTVIIIFSMNVCLPAIEESGDRIEALHVNEEDAVTQSKVDRAMIGQHVRKNMRDLLKRGIGSNETVNQLVQLFENNRTLFDKDGDGSNSQAGIFGAGVCQKGGEDYDLFRNTMDVLARDAKTRVGSTSFAATAHIIDFVRPIVRYDAEWSEYMDWVIIDLSLDAPKAMVEYLTGCSTDEFRIVMSDLSFVCEIDELRERLDNELKKYDAIDEGGYTRTIEKIRKDLNEKYPGCFEDGSQYKGQSSSF